MRTILLPLIVIALFFFNCKKDHNPGIPDDPIQSTDLGGITVFPPDNPWNTDISNEVVDPNSNNLIASIGNNVNLHPDFGTVWDGAPIGIPYNLVSGTQPKVK